MPGSGTPTASEPAAAAVAPPRAIRFAPTERALHWIHACAFFVLLGSGLVLYLPALAAAVGNRPLAKGVHLAAAGLWLTGLVLVAATGDRRALRKTRRQLERLDDDDLLWLRGRPAPQGRFNAGQKLHAVIQAALAVLFTVSGTLLWLGERNTALRLPGTIALHDACMYAATTLVAGHLYLALVHGSTRPALRGMVRGDVDAAWAGRHHAKWHPEAATAAWRLTPARAVAACTILAAGVALTIFVIAGAPA